jgi:two-component system osmolarity sensor histidine kinase EnvZ
MARSVISEMVFVKNSINKPEYENLLRDLTESAGLKYSFKYRKKLNTIKIADSNWQQNKLYQYLKPVLDPYNRLKIELENHHLTPYQIFADQERKDTINVSIQVQKGLLTFEVPIKKITSSSGYVFTFWLFIAVCLTSFISLIFFRNQIRLIGNLSSWAEKFGRGIAVTNPKILGSQEIRSLTISFIKMKERITRQINQRTFMLSSVSHDLRTPLTRMKLQLALMPENEETKNLNIDISDMENLITEYLEFAKGNDKEKSTNINIVNFLQENCFLYYKKMQKDINFNCQIPKHLNIAIKSSALNRALKNLIDNAFHYATKVDFSASYQQKNIIITIEDNGPGIPKPERENVFKPFIRLNQARNLDSSSFKIGSGLGLAITKDAINSQGGEINLDQSTMLGGLKVVIILPI